MTTRTLAETLVTEFGISGSLKQWGERPRLGFEFTLREKDIGYPQIIPRVVSYYPVGTLREVEDVSLGLVYGLGKDDSSKFYVTITLDRGTLRGNIDYE